jgi:hypothetical protein
MRVSAKVSEAFTVLGLEEVRSLDFCCILRYLMQN